MFGFGKKSSSNSTPTDQPAIQGVAETQAGNAQELIAVISAALAAFEGGKAISNLNIRRIIREQGQITVWNNAGRADCMRSRRI